MFNEINTEELFKMCITIEQSVQSEFASIYNLLGDLYVRLLPSDQHMWAYTRAKSHELFNKFAQAESS